jgi:hypothetical protein
METEKPTEEGSVVQERLNWQVAGRDDTKVAQALYAGETIEEMHHLSDAGLLDEFFVFLKDLGMLEAFEQVSQSGVKRTLVPTVQFVLLYFLKVLLGGESMNELPRVLFSNLALMELVGFNAHQCENGLTTRGEASRTRKKEQGPITAQGLADNICKLTRGARWNHSSIRWCNCWRVEASFQEPRWWPWMEAKYPPRQAMRDAARSNKR